MPTHKQPSSKDADAKPDSPRSPFPRYEVISERLADEPLAENASPAAAQPREIEIPRTESYGELWRRAQVRRHRSR
jgi:hypothetical protein